MTQFPENIAKMLQVIQDPEWQTKRQQCWDDSFKEYYEEDCSRKEYRWYHNYFMMGDLSNPPKDIIRGSGDHIRLFPVLNKVTISYLLETMEPAEVRPEQWQDMFSCLVGDLMSRRAIATESDYGEEQLHLLAEPEALALFDWLCGPDYQTELPLPVKVGKKQTSEFFKLEPLYVLISIINSHTRAINDYCAHPYRSLWLQRKSYGIHLFNQLSAEFFTQQRAERHDALGVDRFQKVIWPLLAGPCYSNVSTLPRYVQELNQLRSDFLAELIPHPDAKPTYDGLVKAFQAGQIPLKKKLWLTFTLDEEERAFWHQVCRQQMIDDGESSREFDNEYWHSSFGIHKVFAEILKNYSAEAVTLWELITKKHDIGKYQMCLYHCPHRDDFTHFIEVSNNDNIDEIESELVALFSKLPVQGIASWCWFDDMF
ncbi:hypothetical protein EZV61_14350 [Corallincola luteus]|uniref:Uncharacterized protein n=1 Tax=Corallincola luteus TaxID=1775177 RepID=A0ABY2ALY0_9GAMM|nr:hypothetical protein [Corallincola luteus]TCI02530.1 hypothetical protein EZV61_14350 [Corallincola luteus]